jgi:superfamily II DNA or RNA helicase
MYDASCLRKTANWSTLQKEHKFEKQTFDAKVFLEDLPIASPKLALLLNKIKELDENDMKTHGKLFKHFIFSEVKAGGYGAKIIASGLIASGFQLCYSDRLVMKPESELLKTNRNNFGFLSSTTIFDQAFSTGLKKNLLMTFNKRPDNVHGELVRFMVADGGFKEGIDLFDVKYVHIFEPQTSEADQKQAIGRATRKCGQAGLEFHPSRGWTLHVMIYDTSVPEDLKGTYKADTLFDMYLKNSKVDLRKVNFAQGLEEFLRKGAVDYPLNRNVLEFRVDDIFWGGNAPIPQETQEIPKKKRAPPVPPKLGTTVFCDKPCSINRPSKYVPIGLPLFAVVSVVTNAPLPDKRMKKPRTHFCALLQQDPLFCQAIKTAFIDQEQYIKANADVLLKAIEIGKHMQMGKSLRPAFLRFVYKLLEKKDQQKIATMPNVQKALLQEETTMTQNVSKNAPSTPSEPSEPNAPNAPNAPKSAKSPKSPLTPVKTPAAFQYLLEDIPRVTTKMNFRQLRDYIADNYGQFTWPRVKMENLCVVQQEGGGGLANEVENVLKEIKQEIDKDNSARASKNSANSASSSKKILSVGKSFAATFTPTQDFIRHYFTPENPYKGMLLYHSVGVGKTCSAIATATSTFEREGWTILWVTRTTLKDDIWKNMFDIVCSVSMQERMNKGQRFPVQQNDRMRLLPQNWSIRPMSYKQFTNLISGTNKSYQDLVKKNGIEDPLKKTLLIIDEAHKLYGGYDLLPAEKPDMKKFKAALLKSYSVSGNESVKLLLMTATPYTKDPMELVKLLNLFKEPKEQLPSDFDEFQHVFLDQKTGKFTQEGKDLFLEHINGMVSFLDRGSDAREFAQPKIEIVHANMSERPVKDIASLKIELDKELNYTKSVIKQLDESFLIFKKNKMQQYREEVKNYCGHLKGQEYLDCKNNPTPYMQLIAESIARMSNKIDKIKESHSAEMKRLVTEFNRLKDVYENNISQEHILETKCKQL